VGLSTRSGGLEAVLRQDRCPRLADILIQSSAGAPTPCGMSACLTAGGTALLPPVRASASNQEPESGRGANTCPKREIWRWRA
jgi:hypothetical protein